MLLGLPEMGFVAVVGRKAVEDNVGDGALEALRHLLGKLRNFGARRDDALAVIGGDLAGKDAHERSFAGAVTAQEADALAFVDRAGDVVEQWRAAEADAEVVEANEGHGGSWRGEINEQPFYALAVSCVA